MSTITLPNIRVGSDLQVRVRLKDGGVAIDWSTLSNIKACIYSDAQRALAGRCAFSIDEEDNTLLVCTYAANKPQYLGVNRIVISAKYMGETKTYDKPAFSFVRWTADQEGEQITIDDPDVDVEIEVEDISSSILQEAVDAAFSAADRANEAAEAAEHMVDIHTGPEGKSAYEVAVEEGYTGTEEEWLASLKGDTGETPDISIGTVTTVAPGTPASASMTGTPEEPVLNLSIPQGVVGATPNFTVGTVTTGEPGSSVIVTITGTPEAPVLNLTIPQGMQGNTGSSVEYPYELVNNLTTNDATKGLSAAQGVVLDGKVSQLEAKVYGLALYPENKGVAGTRDANGNTITNTYVSFVKGHTYEIDIDFPSAVTFGPADSFKLMTPSSTANYRTLVAVARNTYAAGKHTFVVNWQYENTVRDYRVGFYTVSNTIPGIGTIVEIRDKGLMESATLFKKVGDWNNEIALTVTNWMNGSLDGALDYEVNPKRNISTLDLSGLEGINFKYASESGYQLSIRFVSVDAWLNPASINLSATDVVSQIGWVDSGNVVIPTGTKSAVIIERKSDNTNISVSESEKVSFSTDSYTMTKAINDLKESIPAENGALLEVHNFINGSLDPNFAYNYDARRLIGTLDLDEMSGFKFQYAVQNGYKLSLRFVSHKQFADPTDIAVSSSEIIAHSGWVTSTDRITIPEGTRSIIVILAKTDDTNIPVSDADKAAFSVIYDNLEERISVIEARTLSKDLEQDVAGFYSGDFVPLGSPRHPFELSLWKTIELPYYAQSFAIYGDYFICFYGNNTSTGSLWRLSDATKIADITFDYGSFSKPHGNVMNFGNEFADGNTDLPLLYISQWDGEGGCLVYDIRLDGSCTLVQTIMVSNMIQDKFGSALGDWVIDNATNSIYSVKYHNNSAIPSATNYDNVCRFALPKLADGSAIALTDSDILEAFTIPFTPIGQDKKISNGMMFIAAGNPSYTNSQKIYIIDLGRKAMISIFDLASYGDEPEGIEILEDGLILGYGYQPQKFFLITTV